MVKPVTAGGRVSWAPPKHHRENSASTGCLESIVPVGACEEGFEKLNRGINPTLYFLDFVLHLFWFCWVTFGGSVFGLSNFMEKGPYIPERGKEKQKRKGEVSEEFLSTRIRAGTGFSAYSAVSSVAHAKTQNLLKTGLAKLVDWA